MRGEVTEEMLRAGVSMLHGTAKDSDTYTVEQIYLAMKAAEPLAQRSCPDCGNIHDPDIRCPNFHAGMMPTAPTELERYYASTCPCVAAERHVASCPKHGTDRAPTPSSQDTDR